MTSESNPPAFPVGYHPEGNSADQPGMTMRDWFSGQVVAAIYSHPTLFKSIDDECRRQGKDVFDAVALLGTKQADAMLKARLQ